MNMNMNIKVQMKMTKRKYRWHPHLEPGDPADRLLRQRPPVRAPVHRHLGAAGRPDGNPAPSSSSSSFSLLPAAVAAAAAAAAAVGAAPPEEGGSPPPAADPPPLGDTCASRVKKKQPMRFFAHFLRIFARALLRILCHRLSPLAPPFISCCCCCSSSSSFLFCLSVTCSSLAMTPE